MLGAISSGGIDRLVQRPLSVAPIRALGGGLDDSARLAALINAQAARGGGVFLDPGNGRFEIATQMDLVSLVGVTIFGAPGATELHGALAPGFGRIFSFDAWNTRVPVTTLSADVVQGSRTLHVAAIGAIVVGSELALFSLPQGGACYTVIAVVGTTITVERPVLRPFKAGTTVALSPGLPKNVHFRDLRLTGAADSAIEFIGGATDCSIERCQTEGTWSTWALNFDYGSLRCHYRDVSRGPTDQATEWWIGFEGAEDCYAEGCNGVAPGTALSFWLNTCASTHLVRCSARSGVVGVKFGADDATGTGCIDCGAHECDFSDSTSTGVAVADGATRVVIDGCAVLRCPTGVSLSVDITVRPPVACVVSSLDARGCTTSGVSVDGGNNHYLTAIEASGCAAALQCGVLAQDGLVVDGLIADDCTNIGGAVQILNGVATTGTRLVNLSVRRSVGQALSIVDGAQDTEIEASTFVDCAKATGGGEPILSLTGRCRLTEVDITFTADPAGTLIGFFAAAASADLDLRDCEIRSPKTSAFLFCIASESAGTMIRLSRVRLVDKGGVGAGQRVFYFSNQANFLSRGEQVDSSKAEADYSLSGGALLNVGSFTLNGATGVDVLWPPIGANSKIQATRRTAHGAAGAAPTYVITPGSKVTFAGTAADLSDYEFSIDGA